MTIVDSHQHFWDLSKFDYSWMGEEDSVLKQNHLPETLKPLMDEAGVDRTVIVQAVSSIDEAWWLLDLADANDWVAGVVTWVDLQSPTVGDDLDALQKREKFCGIRHIWHDEPNDDWILSPAVLEGLKELARRDIPYDLLVRPQHLKYVPPLLEAIPDLRTVIDHIAKPLIAETIMEPWATDLAIIASNPSVHCKFSGMVTEADHENWTVGELVPYADRIVEMFGYDRMMFGSDWPVSTLASRYPRTFRSYVETLGDLTPDEFANVVGRNAERFYGLGKG
ncbi:MAG: amidohydrolase family protein [Chloroflexi bacterium]|nr:amidohydrolase family protein [Chloroflexota bacterium]